MVGIGMCRRMPSSQVQTPVPSVSSTSWTTLNEPLASAKIRIGHTPWARQYLVGEFAEEGPIAGRVCLSADGNADGDEEVGGLCRIEQGQYTVELKKSEQ